LSKFNTSEFESGTQPMASLGQAPIEICRYPDYRESANKDNYTIIFWHILAARLAFIVVFEVCFFLFKYIYVIICLDYGHLDICISHLSSLIQ